MFEIENYQNALARYGAAKEAANEISKIFHYLAQHGNDWKNVVFTNTNFNPPQRLIDLPASHQKTIYVSQWPDINDFVTAVQEYHDSNANRPACYEAIPEDKRMGLVRPTEHN